MESIRIFKDGKRLHIVIDNADESMEELVRKLLGGQEMTAITGLSEPEMPETPEIPKSPDPAPEPTSEQTSKQDSDPGFKENPEPEPETPATLPEGTFRSGPYYGLTPETALKTYKKDAFNTLLSYKGELQEAVSAAIRDYVERCCKANLSTPEHKQAFIKAFAKALKEEYKEFVAGYGYDNISNFFAGEGEDSLDDMVAFTREALRKKYVE